MGFLKKLSFKNITKSISKNISKIRTKKVKNIATATSSTELDNEASDSDENSSLYTQENESFTSLDATSIEDEVFSETFEFTINSSISASDSTRLKSLSRPTLAKIEEEFNFEINTKEPKNNITCKIEKINKDESISVTKNESDNRPYQKEYPRCSRTQTNLKKNYPIQRQKSFSDESDENTEVIIDKCSKNIQYVDEDEEEDDDDDENENLKNEKESKETKTSHVKDDVYNVEIEKINQNLENKIENKNSILTTKDEAKALNKFEQREAKLPTINSHLNKKQKKKIKENDEICYEVENQLEMIKIEIDDEMIEKEDLDKISNTSNKNLKNFELVEESKLSKPFESAQDNQPNNFSIENKTEETVTSKLKKPMNKKQLRKLRKNLNRDVSDDEIQKINTVETLVSTNETNRLEALILDVKSNENNFKENLRPINQNKPETKLTKKKLKKQKKHESLNDSLDIEKQVEDIKENSEETKEQPEKIIEQNEETKDKSEEKNMNNNAVNIEPIKSEKKLTKKQLKKLKQDEKFEEATSESLFSKQEDQKVFNANKEENKNFEPPQSGKKLTKAQMRKLKRQSQDFDEKINEKEYLKSENLELNSEISSETKISEILFENENKVSDINSEYKSGENNFTEVEKDSKREENEKSESSKDKINNIKTNETQISSKNRRKMSKNQMKKIRKGRGNENSEDEPADQKPSLIDIDEDKKVDTKISEDKTNLKKNDRYETAEDFPTLKFNSDPNKTDETINNDKKQEDQENDVLEVNSIINNSSSNPEVQTVETPKNEKPLSKKQLRKLKQNEIKLKPKEEIKNTDLIEIEKSIDEIRSTQTIDETKIDSKSDDTLYTETRLTKKQLKKLKQNWKNLNENETLSNDISCSKSEINQKETQFDKTIANLVEPKNEKPLVENHQEKKSFDKNSESKKEFDEKNLKVNFEIERETDEKEKATKTQSNKIFKSKIPIIVKPKKVFSESNKVLNLIEREGYDEMDHNQENLKNDVLREYNDLNSKKISDNTSYEKLININSNNDIRDEKDKTSLVFRENENSKAKTPKNLDQKPPAFISLDLKERKKLKKSQDESHPKYIDQQKTNSGNKSMTKSSEDCKNIIADSNQAEMKNTLTDEIKTRSHSLDNKENLFERSRAFFKEMENKLAEEKKNESLSRTRLSFRSSSSKNALNHPFNENASKLTENKLNEEKKNELSKQYISTSSIDKNEPNPLFNEYFSKRSENKFLEEKKKEFPSNNRSNFTPTTSKNELNRSFNDNLPSKTDSEGFKIKIIAQNIEQNVHFNPSDSFYDDKNRNNLEIQTAYLKLEDTRKQKDIQITKENLKKSPWNIEKITILKERTIKEHDKKNDEIEDSQLKKSQKINFSPWNIKNEEEKEEKENIQNHMPERKSFNDLRKLFDIENNQDQARPNITLKRHSSYMGEKSLKNLMQEKSEDFTNHKRKPLLENFYQKLMNNKSKSFKDEEDLVFRPVRKSVSLSEEISKEKKVETPTLSEIEKEDLKLIKLEKEIKEKLQNLTTTSSEEEVKADECISSNVFKIKQQIGKKLEANLKHDLNKIINAPIENKNSNKTNVEVLKKSYEVDKSLVKQDAKYLEEEAKILEAKKNCNLKINLLFNSRHLDQNDKPQTVFSNLTSNSNHVSLSKLISKELSLEEQIKEPIQPLQEFNIESTPIEAPNIPSDIIYSKKKFQKSDDSEIKNYFETLTRDYNQRFDKYFGEKQTSETSPDEDSNQNKKTLAYFLKFDEPQAIKKKSDYSSKEKRRSNDMFENYVKLDEKNSEILKQASTKKKLSKKKVKFNLDVINYEPPQIDSDDSIEESPLKDYKKLIKNSTESKNDKFSIKLSANESDQNHFKNEYLINTLSHGSNFSEFNFYETNQINPIEFQSYSNERKPVHIIKKDEKNSQLVSSIEKNNQIPSDSNNQLSKNVNKNMQVFYNEFNRPSLSSTEKKSIPIILNGNKPSDLANKSNDNFISDLENSSDFFYPTLNKQKMQIPIMISEKNSSSFTNIFDTKKFSFILNECCDSSPIENENKSVLFSKQPDSLVFEQEKNQLNATERQHVPIAGKIFSEFKSPSKNIMKPPISSPFSNVPTSIDSNSFNENSIKTSSKNFQEQLDKSENEYIVLDPSNEKKSNEPKENNKGSSVYYQIIELLDSYDQKMGNDKNPDENINFSRISHSDENDNMSYIIDKNDNSLFIPNRLTRPIEEDKQFFKKVINSKSHQSQAESVIKTTPTESSNDSVYCQISNLLEDYFKSNEFSLSQLNSSAESNPEKNLSFRQNKDSSKFVQQGNLSSNQQVNTSNKKFSLNATPTSSISSSRSIYSEISDLLDLYLIQDDIPMLHGRNKFTEDVDNFNN